LLANNELTSLPESITKLKNLTKLDLLGNPIYKVPENLDSLPFDAQLDIDKLLKENDDKLWEEVLEEDSKEAYEKYLQTFPNGKHIKEAKEKLEGFLTIKLEHKSKAVLDKVCKTIFKKSCDNIKLTKKE